MNIVITGGNGDIAQTLVRKNLPTLNILAPSKEVLDVTNEPSVKQFFKTYKCDVLVNNAGYIFPSSTQESDSSIWKKHLDINLYGAYLCSKYAILNGCKTIINVGSTSGWEGKKDWGAYCASKGGLNQLTKTSALELAPFGIRVNAVAPGFIKTKMTKNVEENEIANNFIKASTPLGYMGEPDDIAYAVVYLASNESKYVTGSILYVDGGWTAQ